MNLLPNAPDLKLCNVISPFKDLNFLYRVLMMRSTFLETLLSSLYEAQGTSSECMSTHHHRHPCPLLIQRKNKTRTLGKVHGNGRNIKNNYFGYSSNVEPFSANFSKLYHKIYLFHDLNKNLSNWWGWLLVGSCLLDWKIRGWVFFLIFFDSKSFCVISLLSGFLVFIITLPLLFATDDYQVIDLLNPVVYFSPINISHLYTF